MFMNKRGFSIAEVLVAMFILLVGIIDVIYLTSRGVTETHSATNAVIATMLAQEGTELVRNVRDNNVTRTDCVNGFNRCKAFEVVFPSINHGVTSGYCTVDWEFSGNPMNCHGASGGNSGALFLNTDTGLYSHTQGSNAQVTPFSRRIYVDYAMSDGTTPEHPASLSSNQLIANVTSVVMFGKMTFADIGTIADVESWCKIGSGCAFAQTRLTSWLNYD